MAPVGNPVRIDDPGERAQGDGDSQDLLQRMKLLRCAGFASRRAANDAVTPMAMSLNPAESDTGMFGGNSNWRGPIPWPTHRAHSSAAYRGAQSQQRATILSSPAHPETVSCSWEAMLDTSL
jgi:hypothetical protein